MERAEWFESRLRQGYPVLVAAEGAEVLGFASFGDWRAWPGYVSTVEHSVHVRAERRRSGCGCALLGALLPIARGSAKHVSKPRCACTRDSASNAWLTSRKSHERSAAGWISCSSSASCDFFGSFSCSDGSGPHRLTPAGGKMKAHRLIATLGVAALALSLGIESKAAPLILDGDGRLVTLTEGRPSGGVGAFHLVASNGAPQFDVVLDPTAGGCCAHAEQHSSLLPTGFSGSGSILTGGFDAATENRFDVTFEVSAVTAFQLDGSITGDSYVGYFAGANLQTLSGPFSISGLLEPGVPYEIWLDVLTPNGAVPSTGQWQLTFTVPEPALGLLSLGAFAALALTRRRESPLLWRRLPAAPLSAR